MGYSHRYLVLMVMAAVGRLLFILTCALPLDWLLRITNSARPFHVVTREEVLGSRSFKSAVANAIILPCPSTIASQGMAASGQTRPSRSTTSTVTNDKS